MKGIQGISTTVLHVCRSGIWASVVIHSVALYLIWLCIKCQTPQELTIQTMARFQNKCFPPALTRSAATLKVCPGGWWRFWKNQADCRCRAPKNQPLSCCQDLYFCCSLLLPNHPVLPHTFTPTEPEGWTSLNRQRWGSAPWHWIPKVLQFLGAVHAALQLFKQR